MELLHSEFDIDWDSLDHTKTAKGKLLVPAVIQQDDNGKVLMLVYMSEESLMFTKSSSRLVVFSRKIDGLRLQGEGRDCQLEVRAILPNCDRSSLLIIVHPLGELERVCHIGGVSCFKDPSEEK